MKLIDAVYEVLKDSARSSANLICTNQRASNFPSSSRNLRKRTARLEN